MKITLKDITFSYDEQVPVLRDITTTIGRGSFVALVGPNGSGKSTLIKCINGILAPQKGQILLDDRNIAGYSARNLAGIMAYVPQMEQKMFPSRVFDAVLLGRKPHLQWRPDERDLEITSRILHQLHLEDVAGRDITKLSGGQQQRVFIARALAQEPNILLLDEPTANLDLKHQMDVLQLLDSLAAQGITIIMAMHDINTAAMFGTRILMMKEGAIFSEGGPEIFTADNIRSLYNIDVKVIHENGAVWVVPSRATT